ncbi:MAG: hypothetical protein OEU57_04125 [Desulfuromonadales bacterium]|jgi:hypothetical protein|nr:hypothetical protein [Desulfuromonadales bacterium]MDH4024590.1 hypothetical protein [Desulfuromonadales bacterium]HKJ28770.1 hypothetical protein [Desulfuromonadales bacterium]
MEMFQVVLGFFWLVAGCVSFYFSIGNARVWTSIAVGFFLILVGEIIPGALPFLPGLNNPYVLAMGHIIGTLAILIMSHGFQEYYVFTRTLDFEGSKLHVYLTVVGVIVASLVFLLINPTPDEGVLRVIRIVENTNWVFLSLINIDLIRKIHLNIKDTPISNGFLAFMVVFACIFLWKGSQLYMDVFSLDTKQHLINYTISHYANLVGDLLASLSVGGTFLYLGKLLR